MMRRLLLGALFFSIAANAGELERVVQSAYAKSWEVENANYIQQNAIDDYKNKARAFLPSLTAKATHGYQGDQTFRGKDEVSEYAIEAKSVLFSMTQLDDFKIAHANREIQDLKRSEKKNRFCLDLANLYLTYVLEKKKAANLAQILEILNKQFNVTSSDYRQGLKPRKDYLRLRAELRSTELEQLAQSVGLKGAEDKLRDRLGAEFSRFTFNPTYLEVPEVGVFEEENTKDSVLEQSLQKEVDYLAGVRSKSKHELWPRLVLGANYKLSDKDYWNGNDYEPGRNDYWSVTLGLEYVIWDWGTQRRSSDVVVRNALVRENEVYQEMRNAQNEVDLVRQRIKVARRVYSSRSLLLGDERESFGLISRDYREGRINFLDYVSSLRSFGRAELSLFEGLIELNKAYFEILLHKGSLDDYFKVN